MPRLFTLVAVVSLVICVAACVTWAQSYWVAYEYARSDRGGPAGGAVTGRVRTVYVGRGGVRLDEVTSEGASGGGWSATFAGWRRAREVRYPPLFGGAGGVEGFGFGWGSLTMDLS